MNANRIREKVIWAAAIASLVCCLFPTAATMELSSRLWGAIFAFWIFKHLLLLFRQLIYVAIHEWGN